MSVLSLIKPIIGRPDATEDQKLVNALTAIETWANGQVGVGNLKGEGVAEAAIEKGAVSEAKLSTAVQILLNAKVSGLTLKQLPIGPTNLANGELGWMEETNGAMTLPKSTLGAVVGAYYSVTSGEASVKVNKPAEESISGGFVVEATTVKLLKGQYVQFIGTGTGWVITAGEPKREQGYVAKSITQAEAEAQVEPSPTRMAFVSVWSTAGPTLKIEVGGVEVAKVLAESTPGSCSFLVPPGKKWKGFQPMHVATLLL